MAAYDYDRQEWIEDKAQAQAQAIKQTREHLELLEGNRGAGYAEFIGVDRAQAIREAREALFQLGRAFLKLMDVLGTGRSRCKKRRFKAPAS